MLRFDDQGDLIFICTNCWSIIKLSDVEQPTHYNALGGFYMYYDTVFRMCPSCHNYSDDELFNVDPDIADDIVILNKKGYTTHFCCSSHSPNDSDFYLVFDIPKEGLDDIDTLLQPLSSVFNYSKFEDAYGCVRSHISIKHELVFRSMVQCKNGMYHYEPLDFDTWRREHNKHLQVFHDWVKCVKDFNNGKWKEPIHIHHVRAYPYHPESFNIDDMDVLYHPEFKKDQELKPIITLSLNVEGDDECKKATASTICRIVSSELFSSYFMNVNLKIEKAEDWEDDKGYTFYAKAETDEKAQLIKNRIINILTEIG